MEHDFVLVDGAQLAGVWFRPPYTLWTKRRCKNCGTVGTVIAGMPFYEPKGEFVQDYGELPPPCRK